MKKLLIILFLAAASFAQTPTPTPAYSDSDARPIPSPSPAPVQGRAMTPKLPKGFYVSYDKFKDETDVSFFELGNPQFTAGFLLSGKDVTADVQRFYFVFSGSRCYGFCFNDPTLIFLIDGQRLPPMSRKTLADSAAFFIDRDLLSILAGARLVEFQVGRYEGKWKEKDIAKLKTLLELGTTIK